MFGATYSERSGRPAAPAVFFGRYRPRGNRVTRPRQGGEVFFFYVSPPRAYAAAILRTPGRRALNMHVPRTTDVPEEKLNGVSISPFEYFNGFDRFSTDRLPGFRVQQ